jgi:glycosyltransferase involved in cell wall biosynthesis
MSVYAAWFKAGGWRERCAPASVSLERSLVVCDGEPSASMLHRWLGGVPRVVILPGAPVNPLPGVHYHTFRPGTNPLIWDEHVDEVISQLGIDTMVAHPLLLGGQTLVRLRRIGLRRLVLLGGERPCVTSPYRLAVQRLAARGWRKLCHTLLPVRRNEPPADAMTIEQCRAVLKFAPPRRIPACSSGPLRIAQFVTSLNSGGAERQGCYAALLQKHHGHDIRVLSRVALEGVEDHYRFLLEPEGVPVRAIGSRWHEPFPDKWRRCGLRSEPFLMLPPELRDFVVDLVAELILDPVDVLHGYVDDCNIVGAIAGCLAGVPTIVLSFRNGNPSRFPGLYRPWMLPWYQAILGRPGIVFSSNSSMGARDYESWIGLPPGSVGVVRNAFFPPAVPSRAEAIRWRAGLGIAPEAPVVVGVFRLHPEKRPLYFLDCIAALRSRVVGLRVVMAGVGCLEDQVRRRVAELGLDDVVLPLGQRKDVPLILAGSDVLLLTSDWEGTPNILLEAQHLGCVPVVTDAGGSSEAIDAATTGVLVDRNDPEAAVAAVAALLGDPQRRQRMADAGRAFVGSRFAPEALYRANQALYEQALDENLSTLLAASRK